MAGGGKVGVAAAALSASLALVVSGCGGKPTTPGASSSANPSGATSVKLAFVGPLTGADAGLGIGIRNGAKMAVQEAEGAGVKVDLVEFDTHGDPAQASAIKNGFLHDSGVVGVVGPTLSAETTELLPDLEASHLVMVSPSATNAGLPALVPGETVFHRIVSDDTVQGAAISGYIVKELKPRSAFVVSDGSDYGKGLARGVMASLSAAGIPVNTADIDPKSQDLSWTIAQVKAGNPDVVFYGGYYPEAGWLVNQLRAAGITATFMSGGGSLDPAFIADAGGPNAEGALFSCPCSMATANAGGALGGFAARYAQINGGAQPGAFSAEGYDAANVMINGIKAGHTSRAGLLKYVTSYPPTPGISKTISFQNNGNVQGSSIYFFRVTNGTLTFVGSKASLGL
jgi:branched-chain amino acid transport system substrate-binding protein